MSIVTSISTPPSELYYIITQNGNIFNDIFIVFPYFLTILWVLLAFSVDFEKFLGISPLIIVYIKHIIVFELFTSS